MHRNRVQLIGYLGVDPQLHTAEAGEARVTFTLATHETWRTDNEKKQHVEWHSIVAWGKTALFCHQYLKKGQPVFLEGRLRVRRWTDAQGVRHANTEIHLLPNEIQLLGSKNSEGGASRTLDSNGDEALATPAP